jgi:hypothetical protein
MSCASARVAMPRRARDGLASSRQRIGVLSNDCVTSRHGQTISSDYGVLSRGRRGLKKCCSLFSASQHGFACIASRPLPRSGPSAYVRCLLQQTCVVSLSSAVLFCAGPASVVSDNLGGIRDRHSHHGFVTHLAKLSVHTIRRRKQYLSWHRAPLGTDPTHSQGARSWKGRDVLSSACALACLGTIWVEPQRIYSNARHNTTRRTYASFIACKSASINHQNSSSCFLH